MTNHFKVEKRMDGSLKLWGRACDIRSMNLFSRLRSACCLSAVGFFWLCITITASRRVRAVCYFVDHANLKTNSKTENARRTNDRRTVCARALAHLKEKCEGKKTSKIIIITKATRKVVSELACESIRDFLFFLISYFLAFVCFVAVWYSCIQVQRLEH